MKNLQPSLTKLWEKILRADPNPTPILYLEFCEKVLSLHEDEWIDQLTAGRFIAKGVGVENIERLADTKAISEAGAELEKNPSKAQVAKISHWVKVLSDIRRPSTVTYSDSQFIDSLLSKMQSSLGESDAFGRICELSHLGYIVPTNQTSQLSKFADEMYSLYIDVSDLRSNPLTEKEKAEITHELRKIRMKYLVPPVSSPEDSITIRATTLLQEIRKAEYGKRRPLFVKMVTMLVKNSVNDQYAKKVLYPCIDYPELLADYSLIPCIEAIYHLPGAGGLLLPTRTTLSEVSIPT